MIIWTSKSIVEIERFKHRRRRNYIKSIFFDEFSAFERKSKRKSRRKHRRNRDFKFRHVTSSSMISFVQSQFYFAFSNVFSSSNFVKLKKSANSSVTNFISWIIHDHMKLNISKSELKKRKDFIQIDRMFFDKEFDFQIVQFKKNFNEIEQWWELRDVKSNIDVKFARYVKKYEKWIKKKNHDHSTRSNVLKSSNEKSSLIDEMRNKWLIFYFALISYKEKIRWLSLFLMKNIWFDAR